MNFSTKVPGKWILAGEHAVLRGVPALVFPLKSRVLELEFIENLRSETLTLELVGEHGKELQLLFWGVLEKACELKNISRQQFKGHLRISSTIPIGAGLGASAALCVAVAQWFYAMSIVKEEELYEFSRTLENLFHGESSGVDIAVALSNKGLKFIRNGERTKVEPQWQPQWFVSYSGKRGVTSECVQKVKNLIRENPELGQKIDEQMAQAVRMSEQALNSDAEQGFSQLKNAIELAASCFEQWDLTPKEHIQKLKEYGAIAVKPTGSGGGGYVLSLWQNPPPSEIRSELIPC